MLRTLAARHDRYRLTTPFRISRGEKTAADVVTVTIVDSGVTGRGEGVPYARYGESIESALAEIDAARARVESGGSRADLARAMRAGAARNAIDDALWDLEAKRAGVSVAKLTGLPEPRAIPSAITIGLDAPDAMARAAAIFISSLIAVARTSSAPRKMKGKPSTLLT